MLGTPRREQVAVLPSVSYGMAIVARNLPFHPGQHIVVAGEQFPSNVHPWRRLAGQRGGEVRTVVAPEARDGRAAAWNEALHDAIDERTAMLAIGHVHWADGTRFDLPRLAARAREVGAWVVIDGTQSVGALDFPFDDVRPMPCCVPPTSGRWGRTAWRWAGSAMSWRTASLRGDLGRASRQ